MEYGFNQETYLAHHGVKGMKWGVRRYQNPDGSITSAGKKHYTKKYENEMARTNKKIKKTDSKRKQKAYDNTTNTYYELYSKNSSPENAAKLKRSFKKDYRREYENLRYADIRNNKHYKKGKALSDQYGLTEVSELAKNNDAYMKRIEKRIDKESRQQERIIDKAYKDHPDLKEIFPRKDMTDLDLLEVAYEYSNKPIDFEKRYEYFM